MLPPVNGGDSRTARLTWNAVSGVTHYQIQRYDPSPARRHECCLDERDRFPKCSTATAAVNCKARITKANAKSPPYYEDERILHHRWLRSRENLLLRRQRQLTTERPTSLLRSGTPDVCGMTSWASGPITRVLLSRPTSLTRPTDLNARKDEWGLRSWSHGRDQLPTVTTTGAMRGTASSYTLQWRTSQTSTWNSISGASSPYHHTGSEREYEHTTTVCSAENSGGASAYHPTNAEVQVSRVTLGHTR